MAVGVIMFIAWLVFMALTVVAFIVWGYREGHFKDIEDPKYRMLIDREPEPWPERKKNRPEKSKRNHPVDQTKGEDE